MYIIADNLQITNPVIQKAVDERDPAPIAALAEKCMLAGADAIDVNAGPLSRDGEAKMAFLARTVQEACGLPLSLDTVNPSAMDAGLAVTSKKPIINGLSLQPEKLEGFIPLAHKYDADIVCYMLRPDGHVPRDADGRLEAAARLYGILAESGIESKRLIFDPIVPPLMWEDGPAQTVEVIETVRLLPEVLGYDARTMAGLSNLTTGSGPLEKKLLLERTYLAMLRAAGLGCALLNVFHKKTMELASASEVLCSGRVFSWQF